MAVLFGDFLLERGLISAQALNQALETQLRDQILIGQLAVKEGFLTHTEVLQILRVQRSAGASARKFGEIAVEQGLISEQALREALEAQLREQMLIGQLTIKKGFLTDAEVLQILRVQRSAVAGTRKFGKIAVELGIMTEEAQLKLLQKQEEAMDFLGNILVAQGALDPGQLVTAIKEHNALRMKDAE